MSRRVKAGETTIRDKVPPKVSPWDINDWVVLQKALGRCHNSQEPETLPPIDLVWNSEAEADSFLELPGKLLWLSCLPTSLAAIISRVMASSLLLFISSWRTTHFHDSDHWTLGKFINVTVSWMFMFISLLLALMCLIKASSVLDKQVPAHRKLLASHSQQDVVKAVNQPSVEAGLVIWKGDMIKVSSV